MSTGEPFAQYAGLSTPAVITDPDMRIVYLSPSAERFWQTRLQDVAGQAALVALRLSPPDGADPRDWAREVGFPALVTGDAFTCRTARPGHGSQSIHMTGTRFLQDGEWYVLLTVVSEAGSEKPPSWALTDTLTGLHNRHQWERAFADWNSRAGVVIFLDLDSLKQINDLLGHRGGDRALIATGRAIREHVPEASLAVRYGGDEFVVLLDQSQADLAGALAQRIAASVAAVAQAEPAGVPVHISYGVAAY